MNSTMKQVQVDEEELTFLRTRIREKYEAISGQDFIPTSYLGSYEGLCEAMEEQIPVPDQEEYVSAGLLRKLFYDTREDATTIFRTGFVNACYSFITDGKKTRQTVWKAQKPGTVLKLVPRPFIPKTPKQKRNWSIVAILAVLIVIVQPNLGLLDLRVIPWIIHKQETMHTLWVCIYEDGTRVYNRPRSYRTSSEVQAYFTGKNRKRWKANGDCNAFIV